jgi:hypothetical protein
MALFDREAADTRAECEKLLADALMELASDLRLVEAEDFIAFVRTGQTANIANIVNSSAELYFKPGTLRFGTVCETQAQWGAPPAVSLSLDFTCRGVTAYFRLVLKDRHACVDLDYIHIAEAPSPRLQPRLLAEALAHARLGSPSRQRIVAGIDKQ